MGVTPGSASMARKGSPKAPGSCRTSARVKVCARGSARSPSTVTSMGRWRSPAGGAGGDTTGGGSFGACSSGSGKRTKKRILAATAVSPRRAGSNRKPRAARAASPAKGSSPWTTLVSSTRPVAATTSSRMTSCAPDAPAGYSTMASPKRRGAVTTTGTGDGVAAAAFAAFTSDGSETGFGSEAPGCAALGEDIA
jgi:hypothetical protein